MYFNKNKTEKSGEKKILRKVKKNWVVLSLSFFTAISTGAVINQHYVAHADDTSTTSNSSDSSASASDASSSNSTSDTSSNSTSTSDSSSNSTSSSDTSNSSDSTSDGSSNSTSSSDTSSTSTSTSNTSSNSDSTNNASSNASTSNTYGAKGDNISQSSEPVVVDKTNTTDSFSANDGTGIQTIDDFDAGIDIGEFDGKYIQDAPSWTGQIDPMGAAWAPLINQYINNGYYITVPQDNIEQADQLFNDYIQKYNLSDNYSHFANLPGDYTINELDNGNSIGTYVQQPMIQDESGINNVAQKSSTWGNYAPTDNLELQHIITPIDFGDGGDSDGATFVGPSGSTLYTNHQSLEPYAGHYEAPIYTITMKDLTTHFRIYTDDDGNSKEATIGIPLDYMIYLHPQVHDQNGNLIAKDLTNAQSNNVNYIYNETNQQVGTQPIFALPGSTIDANDLDVPDGYKLVNNNETLTINNDQNNYDVLVTTENAQSSASSSVSSSASSSAQSSASSSTQSSTSSSAQSSASSSTQSSATSSAQSSAQSSAVSFTSNVSYTPDFSYASSTNTVTLVSSASSATSSSSTSASSSASNSSVAAHYYEMYNYKTRLVKRNGKIHIFIQPRYANDKENGNLKHRDVVQIINANGKVTHDQEVTLKQYNAMLAASGKDTFTKAQLQKAYIKRHRKYGIMRDKKNKTTFVSTITRQGNNVLINTNGSNDGFYSTKDHYLVKDTDDLRVKIPKHVTKHHNVKQHHHKHVK